MGRALAGGTGRGRLCPGAPSPAVTGGQRSLRGRGDGRGGPQAAAPGSAQPGRAEAGPCEARGAGEGSGRRRARLRPGRGAGGGTGRRRPELSSGASVAPMRCRRPPGATKEGAGGPRPGGPGEPRGEERSGGAPVGPGPGRGGAGRGRRERRAAGRRGPAGGLGPSAAPGGLRDGRDAAAAAHGARVRRAEMGSA